MAKHLNVSLGFTADASQAKRELQSLQRSLNDLVKNSSITKDDLGLVNEIQGATRAAAQLAVQLKNATNVNTGNLDLTKFSDAMKSSGMTLDKYATQLSLLGPTGEKAFVDLTRSITLAEVPLKRTSKVLDELWVAMKNTTRWQITSSAMHGFMGAVSSAYRYVEDLNASLNDIRIVTGYSSEKMADFAIEANKAAKALSTTTTEYTNASLIYYQQGGMTDEEIAERTAITIKMANAAGESAQKISNQLTSVWNNFYDGTKSLEYYADVMTKLGAVTASSTDEISEGVNKFASVADTIGLSYEYAASALATVTATTRESADVVGTAFKTLFARIQGLKLGETLDDGTTLNKYSEALDAVGISIFDQNNQIKKMDDILDEMGAKWQTISKDQQIALAQTVAGVRQYTKLITLMNNWDFFQSNVETAYGAAGTLNKQAEIYAESWEAANDRVRASAEKVYAAILDDDFFIDLTNGFGIVIDKIGVTIESLGGVKGTLLTIGTIVTKVFSKQIGQSINDAIFSLRNLTKSGRNSWLELKKQANQALIDQYRDQGGEQGSYKADIYTALGRNQLDYIALAEDMSQEEQAINQLLMDRNRQQAEIVQGKVEELRVAKQQREIEKESLDTYFDNVEISYKTRGKKNKTRKLTDSEKDNAKAKKNSYINASKNIQDLEKTEDILERMLKEPFDKANLTVQQTKNELDEFFQRMAKVNDFKVDSDFEKLDEWIGDSSISAKELITQLNNFDEAGFQKAFQILENKKNPLRGAQNKAFDDFSTYIKALHIPSEQATEILQKLQIAIKEAGYASAEASQELYTLNYEVDNQRKGMSKTKEATIDFGDAMVNAGNFVMGAASAVTSLVGMFDVLQDETASTGDKIIALVSMIGTLVPTVQSLAPAFSKAKVSAVVFGQEATKAAGAASLAMWQVTLIVAGITALVGGIVYLATKESEAEIAARAAKDAAQELADAAENAKTELENLKSAFDSYDTAVEKLNECVKGTTEWEEALKNVNAEVISLLAKTPDLVDYITGSATTGYSITQAGREKILNDAQARAYGAEIASLEANSKATTISNYEELKKIGSSYENDMVKYYGELSSGLQQSAINSQYLDVVNMTSIQENLSLFAESLSNKEFLDRLAQIGITSEVVTRELLKYKDTITNIAIKEEQNLKSRDIASDAYIRSILGAEASEVEIQAANAAREKAYNEIVDSLKPGGYNENLEKGKEGLKSRWWRGNGGENDPDVQNVWKRYQAAAGVDYELVDLSGKNGIKGFTYIDENADKQFISITQLSEAIASFETSSKEFLTTATNEVKAVYNTLNGTGKQTANVLSQGIEKNNFTDYLLNFSGDDLNTLAEANVENYSEDVEAALGMTEDQLKSLAESFGSKFSEVFSLFIEVANKIKDDISTKSFSELGDTSSYSSGQLYKYSQARDALFKNDTFDALPLNAINVASQNRDNIDGVIGFMDELSTLQFNVEGSTEKLQELAEKYNLSGDALDNFVSEVDALDKQFNISSASINEQAAGLKEIVNNLNTGDIVSAEDIALLEQAGIDTSDYFSQMADGSFMLTAAAKEFKGLVGSITFEALKNQLDDFERARVKAATGKWFDTYLTDTRVVEGSYAANSTRNQANEFKFVDDLGRARLDYISKFAAGSFDFNPEQLQLLEDYQSNPELVLTSERLQQIADMIDIVNQSQSDLQAQLFTTAISLAELDAIAKELGTYDYSAYADGLINLASQYKNCSDKIQEFQTALLTGSKTAIKAAEDNLRAATIIGEAAEKYDLEVEVLEAQADRLADTYGISAEAATNMAVKNQRMNKGVSSLVDNWKDWKKQLSATDKLTEDYAKTIVDCTKAIADLVGASSDLELPDKFFNTENMALLERAVQGDIDAINALGAEVAWFTVDALEFNEGFAALASELESFNGFDISKIDLSDVLNADKFDADKDLVLQGITDIKNGLITEGQGMTDEWVAALNRMAITTGMSVEQMNGLLGSLGVQAKVETTYIKQPMEVPTYSEQIQDITYREVPRYEVDENGEQKQVGVSRVPEYRKATVPGKPVTVEGYVAVAQISTEDNPMTADVNESVAGGKAPMTSSQSSGAASYTPTSSRGSVSPSAKKGSGGSKSKPAKKIETTKKEDVIDRYKELEDSLDDLTDALNDANKMEDRLWGQSRIDNIKQQNELLQKQISLLKDKVAAAKNYLAIDKATLDQAAKNAGVNFVYDEAGNLTNYTQQMEILYAKLRAAQDAWNADYVNRTDEEQQKYEENILQPIQDKIDELKAAIDAYEQTRELIEDLENELDDAFYEWQDNNYEMLHYKLEVEIEINDLELEMLDYYLNKLSDDFYQLAESAQFMVDKIPTITDSLGHYENFYNEITAAYAAGEISQADYVEGMKESYSAILDNLTALNDLDKEMLHYYEDTLAAASEELAYYTDQMEHLTNVLDHYRNIVKLVNGEYDYKSINTILTARTETIKNELDVATANYQMLLTEKAAIEASLAGAADDAAREVFENELKAITTAVNEAQEEMLSKTEQWAEEMKALMENTLAEAAHQMEMSFTNGIGFDRLNDSLDRLSAYSEIYLTKTNQIYETQKLMNTAQMAIDKTTNEAAKVRLDNYIKEIEVLQDKNKLTKIELDLAQARYDVLLAEIALEEAQNAKSTVRLQRDNEGNFGYVYTADQEAVSQAEQDLLDAQNALYNIGLEGTNEYGQKLLELQQQLSDQLIALEEARVEGQFATDAEYYAARDKLIKEYTDLFAGYSEAYSIALGEDLAIQEEAWIQAYSNMIDQSLDWKDKTTQYTEECENAYESWRETVQTESAIVDSVLNDLESEVKDVTSASTLLRNEVVGNVIPAINNELVAVRNVTSAYAAQRAQIQELIAYYEQLAQAILNAIRAQASASQNTAQQQQQQNYAPVDDYSREMAEHLAGGGSTTDEYYQWLLAERNKKLQQEEYAKYQSTANQLYDTLEQYGKDQAVTDYVDMLVKDNKKYFYDANGNIIAITSMASGGYTGAWGPEGRLAVLHEKELVLNAQDTENILTAANVIRQLADIIDLEALHSSQGFGMSFSQASLSSSAGQLEQMVTIEAHFPAVQDRNEIEEAFNNLINTASQYANRK